MKQLVRVGDDILLAVFHVCEVFFFHVLLHFGRMLLLELRAVVIVRQVS